MKIIFLDNDGVVCLSTEWGGRGKKKSKYLKEFPGAESSMPAWVKMDNFNYADFTTPTNQSRLKYQHAFDFFAKKMLILNK